MAVALDTYTGLKAAVADWLGRAGDTDLADRFDDFLALHEHRMYYGAKEVMGLMPAFEPLRIREMETVNTSFALAATVALPTGFLDLIECRLNNEDRRLDVVAEGTLDGYAAGSLGGPGVVAVSGTNLRVMDDPGSSYTATLRYFAKLTTPSAASANWLLTNTPGLYLYGCLLEAAMFLGNNEDAQKFGLLYAAQVGGLNQKRNSELRFATNVVMRLRGRTP